MKNILFIIMLMCVSSDAVSKFTYHWTVRLTGDTVTVTKLKRNYDSILVWANKVSDSLNQVVPRSNWFTDHSKTFAWMNIDTISGTVRCDTIVADSLGIRILRMTGLPSGGTGDSCLILKSGVPTIISASSYRVMIGAVSTVQLADSCFIKANKLHGVTTGYVPYATNDSTFNESCISASATKAFAPKLYVGKDTSEVYSYNSNAELVVKSDNWTSINIVSPKGYYSDLAFSDSSAGLGRYSGRISYINPPKRMAFYTNATERFTIDSTGKFGINTSSPDSTLTDSGSFRVSGNAKIGGHLNAATSTYTGAVNVDSLKSTKGVSATTGNFSSTVGADSLRSTKGISATTGNFSSGVSGTTGNFSSTVGADSLRSTKGISATYGRFSNAIFGTSATYTGAVNVDSLNATKGVRITSGKTTMLAGADTGAYTVTDDVRKTFNLVMPSYDTGEEPISLLSSYSSPLVSSLAIGNDVGYGTLTGRYNALTELRIKLASAVNTLYGTERFLITYDTSKFSNIISGTSATFSSTVTVDSLKSTKGISATTGNFLSKVQGLYFTSNGEDSLIYEDTTFYDSLYDGSTYRARSLCRIVRIGRTVCFSQTADITAQITATTTTYLKGIPAKYVTIQYNIPILIDLEYYGRGALNTSGYITIYKVNGDYLDVSAGAVFTSFSATWNL